MNLPNKYKNITLRQVYGIRKVIDGKDYSGNEVINYEGGIVFYDLIGGVSYDFKTCKSVKSQRVKGVMLVKGVCERELLAKVETNLRVKSSNLDSVQNIRKQISDKTKVNELLLNYTCITFEFTAKWEGAKPVKDLTKIVNSNGTWSQDILCGQTFKLPDTMVILENENGLFISQTNLPSITGGVIVAPNSTAILTDTDGNVLSTTEITGGETGTIIAPDANIELNGVQTFTAQSGGVKNINLIDKDGATLEVDTVSGDDVTLDILDWKRPFDWLPMPENITASDQTFVGLHAVHEVGQNYCAFRFTTSSGQYEVDWGDGTTTLHNSATTAEHEYDYATYDTAGDTISTRGYKQAMIVVTPVSGDLTACTFNQVYTTTPAQNQPYSTGFLDCIFSMPNGSIIFGAIANAPRHRFVERVEIKSLTNTNVQHLFEFCSSLQKVILGDTSNITNMFAMFRGCISLRNVPLFDTSNVTTMQSMFFGCNSLESVPFFDTSSVTNMQQMFFGCSSLQSVPFFDTSNVTTMSEMFNGCSSLQSVPFFDTSSVTNMLRLFFSCSSLKLLPLFNTSSVTNMAQMCNGMTAIQTIPTFDTTSVTEFGGFMTNCNSLKGTDIIFTRTVDIRFCQLSREAIVNIFNNLTDRTGLTAQNINISGNWGASALTTGERDIALNKNWTITG